MSEESDDLRKLTTEEVYQDLYREFKKAMVYIGQLNSEIDELKFLKETLEKQLNELKKPDKEEVTQIKTDLKKTDYIQGLLDKIKRLEDQNVRLRKDNGDLISKIITHEKRLQKQT